MRTEQMLCVPSSTVARRICACVRTLNLNEGNFAPSTFSFSCWKSPSCSTVRHTSVALLGLRVRSVHILFFLKLLPLIFGKRRQLVAQTALNRVRCFQLCLVFSSSRCWWIVPMESLHELNKASAPTHLLTSGPFCSFLILFSSLFVFGHVGSLSAVFLSFLMVSVVFCFLG